MAGMATPSPTPMLPFFNRNEHNFSNAATQPRGTYLESRLFMAGMATPSPTPMHALMASSTGKPSWAAMGVKAVAMDHQITPKLRTLLPPNLSAHTPPSTWVSRYPLQVASIMYLKCFVICAACMGISDCTPDTTHDAINKFHFSPEGDPPL